MEGVLRSLLTLSVLCAHRYGAAAATNITSDDLREEISKSLCSLTFFNQFPLFFSYCAQDGVPSRKCGE